MALLPDPLWPEGLEFARVLSMSRIDCLKIIRIWLVYLKQYDCMQIILVKNTWTYNCFQRIVIVINCLKYLKSYDSLQIISIREEYLKPYNCVQTNYYY